MRLSAIIKIYRGAMFEHIFSAQTTHGRSPMARLVSWWRSKCYSDTSRRFTVSAGYSGRLIDDGVQVSLPTLGSTVALQEGPEAGTHGTCREGLYLQTCKQPWLLATTRI